MPEQETSKQAKGNAMSRRRIRRIQAAAAVGAVALAAAACSSSSSTTTASTSGTSGASGPASAPSSSAIVVGGMAPLTSQLLTQPEIEAGIVAAIDALNAKGGIDGHQGKLHYCDTQYTNPGAVSCMDQMISDKVSAVIAPSAGASASVPPFALAQ